MAPNVTLTVKNGPLKGKRYFFPKRQICLIGRAYDCDLHLPWELAFQTVSRHHCLLDIDPPDVHARDLGSRNGTYVNGLRVGSYVNGQNGNGSVEALPLTMELRDGDELSVAGTVFEVHLNESPDDRSARAEEHPSFIDDGEALEAMIRDSEEELPSAYVGCAQACR